jgi:uncharacterized protein (TIGR00297 family)
MITGGLILDWVVFLGGSPAGFFISSSLLSKAFRRKALVNEKFSGQPRDWEQVLANGGLGVVLVLAYTFMPGRDWIWVAFVGTMAGVNADTWSTEVGILSPVPPRLITTGKVVESGTSGGITLLGSLAAFLGSLLVAVVAAIFFPASNAPWLILAGSLGGLAGSLGDSLMGATLQGIYTCPTCKETGATLCTRVV